MKKERERDLTAEIVAIFDVRMPKRLIIRELQPQFNNQSGRPQVRFYFLNRRPALVKSERCDKLADEELIEDIKMRVERYWSGNLCLVFTADRHFYNVANRAIRKSPLLLINVPLWGREHFSRRAVSKILKRSIVPILKRMRHAVREKGVERTQEYFRKRPSFLRPQV